MDEQKDNQDLVVGSDGSMNDSNAGEKIEVKTDIASGESATPSESVNETAPPPEAEIKVEETDSGAPESDNADVSNSSDNEQIIVKQPPQEADEEPESETSSEKIDSNEPEPTGLTETNVDSDIEANNTEDPMVATAATFTPTGMSSDSTQSFNSPAQNTSSDAPKPKENRNNKKLAVIVTVIVALVLAGGAVYMYLSAESNTEESTSTTQTENNTESNFEPATPSDIDQTTQEVDEAINALDDASDFNEEELSDQNLGL